ncbi:MAG TPA: response regulator, partial [Methanoregulaceae archaeon]|nr:response regulator [Methanoregulaceae archaeon]
MYRILYVDDENYLLDLSKSILEAKGEFVVDTLTSACEALKQHNLQQYDAIISDYQMPEMDGIAFLRAVREQFHTIPFILFTGRGREEIVIEAINNGA